jgi:hypothetical protein
VGLEPAVRVLSQIHDPYEGDDLASTTLCTVHTHQFVPAFIAEHHAHLSKPTRAGRHHPRITVIPRQTCPGGCDCFGELRLKLKQQRDGGEKAQDGIFGAFVQLLANLGQGIRCVVAIELHAPRSNDLGPSTSETLDDALAEIRSQRADQAVAVGRAPQLVLPLDIFIEPTNVRLGVSNFFTQFLSRHGVYKLGVCADTFRHWQVVHL